MLVDMSTHFDAYAAGLFDGEGTIGIYRVSGSSPDKAYWSVKLQIVGTHRPMIQALHSYYGVGTFTTQKRQALNRTPMGEVLGKQGWKWAVQARPQVRELLEVWTPYLHEKREQCEIALGFIKGDIDGESAERRCKAAKKFVYPDDGTLSSARTTQSLRGSLNPSASIGEDTARTIKEMLAFANSHQEVADHLGVSKSVVDHISAGKTWKHVEV